MKIEVENILKNIAIGIIEIVILLTYLVISKKILFFVFKSNRLPVVYFGIGVLIVIIIPVILILINPYKYKLKRIMFVLINVIAYLPFVILSILWQLQEPYSDNGIMRILFLILVPIIFSVLYIMLTKIAEKIGSILN